MRLFICRTKRERERGKNWYWNQAFSIFKHLINWSENKLLAGALSLMCMCMWLCGALGNFVDLNFCAIININIMKLYFINNYKMWFNLIKLVVKGALIRSIFNLYTLYRDINLCAVLSHHFSSCVQRTY